MANAAPEAGEWDAIRLTEARQVSALMGHDRDDWPAPEIKVRDGYKVLRDAGRLSTAAEYLAHALPRLEAVAWAARIVEDDAERAELPTRSRHSLDLALRWLGDRSDLHRRAAREAADAIGKPVAERFLGLAVFYSGGSIAPPHQPPLMPPEHVAARYVIAAISQVAYRGEDSAAAFARALDLGEAVAERGLAALSR